MAKKPMTPFIRTTKDFEASKKDTEKKGAKEGSKREEKYDTKQKKK